MTQTNTSSFSTTSLGRNPILRTDSYKASHWLQYPPGTTTVYSYVEARGGQFSHSVMFGLQAWLREYLAHPVTRENVEEATELFAAHGEPFNRDGWMRLIEKHGGHFPVRIRAVQEGSVVPIKNALLTIENTDPEFFWLTSFLETELLRAIWYPTTVATLSAAAKATIKRYLEATSDDAAGQIGFKLHDFGGRGVSSLESAALGGLAHLVNFMGTDTVIALQAGRRYYDEPMAGFSIPAAEHSTITSWGRDHERDAYRNMIRQFGKSGAIFAVVSDSYDIFNACEHIWGEDLKAEVIASGATLVVRPDSGEPAEVVLKVARILDAKFGSTINSKGYRVLNHVRIIQGDGVNLRSLRECLSNLFHNGYSADNIAFGMGGGLLQQVNRDTMQWAMKCSAMQIKGEWHNVYKSPIGDVGKASKRGRIEPFALKDGSVVTIDPNQTAVPEGATSLLHTIYENGKLLQQTSFANVRERAAVAPERLVSDWMAL
jgi:nicotinamide phosphoribosyltransferase